MQKWVRFGHLAIFGFTALQPLLGAATADVAFSAGLVLLLVMTALCFHLYAYVFNDLIDLPIDRTQPDRQGYPLVTGAIGKRLAWFVVGGAVLGNAGILLWWGASWLAWLALVAAHFGMALYNLGGKRWGWPLLTDLIQGSSWGALLIFGAAVASRPTPRTWVLAAWMVLYILLVNGVSASLRDLPNDHARGGLTTAIWLGARAQGNRLHVATRLRAYAVAVFLLQAMLLAWGGGRGLLLWAGQGLAALALAWLLRGGPQPALKRWAMAFNVLLLLALLGGVMPAFSPAVQAAVVLVFALPLLFKLIE